MTPMSEAEFARLIEFVRKRYGINLEHKRELVVSRLAFDVEKRGFRSFGAYLDAVTRAPDGEEGRHMINRLSTNHTFFFREPDAITHLSKTALPERLSQGAQTFRVWSAASASGEEAYSLAMQLDFALSVRAERMEFSVLATDVNTDVLARGECATYPNRCLGDIPERFARVYARHADAEHFTVAPELRARVEWRRLNLMEPFAFAQPFDAIFCRNVMFYFLPETRKALVGRLCAALRPGGYLYVGLTETIDLERRYVESVAPSIYRKGG